MISPLPVAGGFIALSKRCLSPAVVIGDDEYSNAQSFVCGWSYWFSYAIGIPIQLVEAMRYISYWDTDGKFPKWARILTLSFIPVFLNVFNVRRN